MPRAYTQLWTTQEKQLQHYEAVLQPMNRLLSPKLNYVEYVCLPGAVFSKLNPGKLIPNSELHRLLNYQKWPWKFTHRPRGR